jgi:hypothetical protein
MFNNRQLYIIVKTIIKQITCMSILSCYEFDGKNKRFKDKYLNILILPD